MRKYLNVEETEWQRRRAFLQRLSENQDGISVSSAVLLLMGTDRVANCGPNCQMQTVRQGDGVTERRGELIARWRCFRFSLSPSRPVPPSATTASEGLSVLA